LFSNFLVHAELSANDDRVSSLRRRVGGPRRATASVGLLSRVIAGSVLLSVLVVGTFFVLLVAMSDLRSSTNEQARSKQVTAATLGLERVVNQLDASLRAYVISGNNRFLSAWRGARADLSPARGKVERLVEDQPVPTNQARRLSELIRAYISEYGLPLIAIAHRSPDAARSPVATKEGLTRIGAIREQISRLLASEDTLASARAAAAKRESDRAVGLGVAELVATAGLLLLFGVFLARGVARPVRSVAEGASRVAAGDLSTRLPETGAAEIQELTRAFNAMARSLEQGKRELEAQNEQLRQSERLKSELVSIVSHELRTPLASILGYTNLLLKRDVSQADSRRYAEIINTQGLRLASLAEEFLDVKRIEAGGIELDEHLLDLKPLLVEETELIANETTEHHIEVAIPARTLPVRGDRNRLAQVFGNLLANAVKYSPEGGLIEVRGEVAGDAVRVQVRDGGVGIPAEYQPRIFTKFFRGEARESGIAGTGLGLAVSREIVEAQGGHIGFTSAPGVGSSCWVELPLADERR
jgi:signal transduction histidine kinase